MKRKALGKTGLEVSEVCLGMTNLGGGKDTPAWRSMGMLPQPHVDAIIGTALKHGVNFFDASDVRGESEALLGRSLKNLGVDRESVVLATKIFGPGDGTLAARRVDIVDSVKASLERLQVDHIDLCQLHGDGTAIDLEAALEALSELVGQGLVGHLGVSGWSAWSLAKALGVSEAKHYPSFVTMQVHYGIAARDLERDVVRRLESDELSLLAWSPMAAGMPLGPPGNGRSDMATAPWPIVQALRETGQAHGVSIGRVALAWLLGKAHVTSTVIGVSSREEAEDNLAATALSLTSEQVAHLDRLSSAEPDPDIDEVGRTKRGVFVATSSTALRTFTNETANYSVCGYARRMEKGFGLIYLGLNDGPEYRAHSHDINVAIGKITENEAFDLAYRKTCAALPKKNPAKFDINDITTKVLAGVCVEWFALPDGHYIEEGDDYTGKANCPGQFAPTSAYIFDPQPNAVLKWLGKSTAKKLRDAALGFVKAKRSSPPAARLSKVIFATFPDDDDMVARTLIGVMMGFLPTAEGNLRNSVASRRKTPEFKDLKAKFQATTGTSDYARAQAVLRDPLIGDMQRKPVPARAWRTAVQDHQIGDGKLIDVLVGDRVSIEIKASTRKDNIKKIVDPFPIFGGDRSARLHPTHACPGYAAAMGVMLGVVAALMDIP